jgi:hypothetical protein
VLVSDMSKVRAQCGEVRCRGGCGVKGLLEARGGDGTQERGSEKGDSGWSGRYYYPPRARTQPSRRFDMDGVFIPARPMQ